MIYFQKIKLTNLSNIFITISDNENMLKPQPLLFFIGNSFSSFQNGKSIKINKVTADSASLNSTSNTPNMIQNTSVYRQALMGRSHKPWYGMIRGNVKMINDAQI